MKVVAVNASPRSNGNCEVLVDQFLKGAKEAGCEVEKINLRNYKLSPCIGCEYCRTHNKECIYKDDAPMLIESIIDSDVFVLASPVYFGSLSAQMKIFIDRFFAKEYKIRDADRTWQSYLLLTSGAPKIEFVQGAVMSYKGFIQVLRKVNDRGIIDGCGAFNKGDAKSMDIYDHAYEMGKQIVIK